MNTADNLQCADGYFASDAGLFLENDMGWQTIDNAPLDCAVLGYQKLSDSIWIIAPMYFYVDNWLLMQVHNDNTEYAAYPTHWMPIPNPPVCDLQSAIEKGTKAWADIEDPVKWVDELRGNDIDA